MNTSFLNQKPFGLLRMVSALLSCWSATVLAQPSVIYRPATPFVALATGHVEKPYRDEVKSSFALPLTQFRITQGTLPQGLTLDANTGVISGVPKKVGTSQLRIAGTAQAGGTLELRAALSIFSRTEAERVNGQNFMNAGPHAVTRLQETFSWVSSYDFFPRDDVADVFLPAATAGNALPVFVFHRGRGFNYFDYSRFLTHLASWGIACASVSDPDSFTAPGQGAPNSTYDSGRPELGMLNASSAQEALMDQLLTRNSQVGHLLSGRLNPEAVFIAGHSRGGGATQASHQRSLALRLRGVIYFMAYDLRFFAATIPPGSSPAYGIETAMARLPSLIVSGSHDGDITYPYADALIDRATGPTTFVTLHRGIHNYLSDDANPDFPTTLTRDEQLSLMGHFVVAFIKRWSFFDVSLEGQLYGSEWATAQQASVAYWRNTSPRLMIDDFQDADMTQNLLGGAPLLTHITRSEQTVYPNPYYGRFDSMDLKHSVLLLRKPSASFQMSLGPKPIDVTSMGVLEMRFKNDRKAFDYDAWVKLTDAAGQEASVQVAYANGQSSGYFPGPPQNDNEFNRFRTLSLPLQDFARANRLFDFSKVQSVTWVFDQANNVSVALDDVRFEGGPVLETLRVRHAADGRDAVSPGGLASLEGSELAPRKFEASTSPATDLLGTRVWLEDSQGTTRAARLVMVSPTQVKFEVPPDSALGQGWVHLETQTGQTRVGKVQVTRVAPGLFSANGDGQGVAAAAVLREDLWGKTHYEELVTTDLQTGKFVAMPVNLNQANNRQTYLVLFGTGIRNYQKQVTVTLAGVPAQVVSVGPQGVWTGVDQIQVRLTRALVGKGTVNVVLTADGLPSNTVNFEVR